MSVLWQISDIKIEGRYRRHLGDVSSLAESIKAIGLINAVTITPDGTLIAGHRRIEAYKKLGYTTIPARVVDSLTTATELLVAERDENTCRLQMKPSELVALGLALEELERPKAAERKANAGTSNLPTVSGYHVIPTHEDDPGSDYGEDPGKARTRDVVGGALGLSATSYTRARTVLAETQNPDPEVRAIAEAAVREMDETGKVTPAFNKVAEVTGRKPAARHPKPAPARPSKPTNLRGSRRKHLGILEAFSIQLSGGALALDVITELDNTVTAEEAARIRGDLSNSLRSVNRVLHLLKERTSS